MLEDIRFANDFLNPDFPSDICYNNHHYKTALHAFYAARSQTASMHRICSSRDASYASKMGRRAVPVKDWDSRIQFTAMNDILRHKFLDNPDLANRLMHTPDRLLNVYNTSHETIWGICICDKCGCNLVVDSFGTRAPVKKKSGAKPVLGVVSLIV